MDIHERFNGETSFYYLHASPLSRLVESHQILCICLFRRAQPWIYQTDLQLLICVKYREYAQSNMQNQSKWKKNEFESKFLLLVMQHTFCYIFISNNFNNFNNRCDPISFHYPSIVSFKNFLKIHTRFSILCNNFFSTIPFQKFLNAIQISKQTISDRRDRINSFSFFPWKSASRRILWESSISTLTKWFNAPDTGDEWLAPRI